MQKVNQFKARATKDSSTMTSGRPHQPSLFCFGRNSCGKANSTLVSKAISFAASSLKGGGGGCTPKEPFQKSNFFMERNNMLFTIYSPSIAFVFKTYQKYLRFERQLASKKVVFLQNCNSAPFGKKFSFLCRQIFSSNLNGTPQ